eukprot:gene2306-3163_t
MRHRAAPSRWGRAPPQRDRYPASRWRAQRAWPWVRLRRPRPPRAAAAAAAAAADI